MKAPREILLLGVAPALAGCATHVHLSPAQLEAIQTRSIDAPPEIAFRAAAGVMLDRGMIITLSDGGAGLIGASGSYGQHVHGRAAARSPYTPVDVVVWVRPGPAGRSIMRAQFSASGTQSAEQEIVSRFAEDVGKRTLAAPRSNAR